MKGIIMRAFLEIHGNCSDPQDETMPLVEHGKELDDYTEDMGYFPDDIEAIRNLDVSEKHTTDNLNVIIRLK
jgi:hypothetical protein